jgi:hypothetical protein
VITAEFIQQCIGLAKAREQARSSAVSTVSDISHLSFDSDAASSVTSHDLDPYAISKAEANFYYAGLPSAPKSIYSEGGVDTTRWTTSDTH